MEKQFMPLLEEIRSLVKANLEGQKAFEERFDRRLTDLETKVAENTKILFSTVKEISKVKDELIEIKNRLAALEARTGRLEAKVEQLDIRTGRLETKVGQLDIRTGQLETKVEQLGEKITLGIRKNEIWFDLIAREYGKLRLELDVLKEEITLSGVNTG
ncbi:MAG: Chromosome partition protein Smc [Firmicutes bacterium ADurb.Bin456]|nr:MAG: Chromosome partition protein Smc [Firmicutes bacterium ADurb.Bin456]